MSSIQLSCTQEDHQKFIWPMPKVEEFFFPTKWHEIFFNFESTSRISPHPIRWVTNTDNSLHFTIWKIWIHQSTFWTCTNTSLLPVIHDRCLKEFPFDYYLPGCHYHLQQDYRGTLRPHQTSLKEIMECSVIDEIQQMPLLYKRNPVSWAHT